MLGGSAFAQEGFDRDVEPLYAFDFSTLSWSKVKLTGKPLKQLAAYQATCHQGSLVVMGGVQHRDEETGRGRKPADTVYFISPQYTPPAGDEADTSSMRYELGSDLRGMLQERHFTDLTIQVDGRTWEVHKVVLASCSPLFNQVLQCGLAPGTHLS